MIEPIALSQVQCVGSPVIQVRRCFVELSFDRNNDPRASHEPTQNIIGVFSCDFVDRFP